MANAIYPTGLPSPSYSTRNSREHLLPKSQRPRSLRANHVRNARALQLQLAASKSGAVAADQKRSHGIGGAGNIRRPSEVIYPVKLNADGTKKRGIAWSTKSTAPGLNQNGKRPALLGMFGRKGNLGSKTTTTARVVEQHPTTDQREGAGRKKTETLK